MPGWSALHPVQVGVGGPMALVGTLTILAVAQVGSLFSSDAWNNVTFTAGEVRNPQRNLPLSLALGTGAVTLLYVLANVVYLNVLPLHGRSPTARPSWRAAFSMPRKTASPRPSWSRSSARRARRSWPSPS